jgi:hypothetical protein
LLGLPCGKGTLLAHVLTAVSVWVHFTVSHVLAELLDGELGETPVLGSVDLLSSWELHLGSSESLVSVVVVGLFGSDGEDWVTDVDSADETVWLTVGTSHTGLEPIGTSTRQHLVDSSDVVRVWSDSQVEGVLTAHLGHVLVGTDTGSLERLGTDLFVLVGDHDDVDWEVHDVRLLVTEIENSNLGIWNTSVESRFWVRLVLAISVAPSWSSSHGEFL